MLPRNRDITSFDGVFSNPSQPLLDKQAAHLLHDLADQTAAWEGWKVWVSGIVSFLGSSATSSSGDHFANKLLEGETIRNFLSEDVSQGLHWPITVAATTPNFVLSFNSNFNVWNRLLNSFEHITLEDLDRHKLPLLITALSAAVSFKVNWDAWQHAPQAARIALSAGRALSALGTNGLFAIRMQKNIKNDSKEEGCFNCSINKSPAKNILNAAQKKLKQLAKQNPEDFIKALSESKLFTYVTNLQPDALTTDAKESINNIFSALFDVMRYEIPEENNPHNKNSRTSACARVTAYVLGTASAVSYFKSGISLVQSFGVDNRWYDWPLKIAFGLSSATVNAAINIQASADIMERLIKKAQAPEWKVTDCLTLLIKLYLLLGYSLANAGMALEYPSPVDNKILAWIEAGINFFVYMAIGNMSIENFLNKITTGYYSKFTPYLVEAKNNCKKNVSLYDSYQAFEEDEKKILVRLLDDYFDVVFETLKNFFNNANEHVTHAVLSLDTRKRLDDFNHPPHNHSNDDEKHDREPANHTGLRHVNSGLLQAPLAFTSSSTPVPNPLAHAATQMRRRQNTGDHEDTAASLLSRSLP